MIDRILQAFSESISRQCVESSNGILSTDGKKASDAAYLLSFSIIMLNTDLRERRLFVLFLSAHLFHSPFTAFVTADNENIRADRKMKLKDFVRNNTNYGKEISDKDFPLEYLEAIYK